MYLRAREEVVVVITKLFRSNRTQALRLPAEVAFAEDCEVAIVVEGDARVITPVDRTWDRWFARAEELSDWPDRDQPPMQERDWW